MPYSQIEAILDPSIVARERAAIPRCAEVLANAGHSRQETIEAAMIYFSGIRMGETCVKVDYLRAFAMLDAIGETETRAAFSRAPPIQSPIRQPQSHRRAEENQAVALRLPRTTLSMVAFSPCGTSSRPAGQKAPVAPFEARRP